MCTFNFLWLLHVYSGIWKVVFINVRVRKLSSTPICTIYDFEYVTYARTRFVKACLFSFKFKIYFSISASLTSTKLKLEAYLYLLSIAVMLRCFLCFKIAFRVWSLIFKIKESESGYLQMLRSWITLEKKVVKTLAVSLFVFKISPFSGKFIFPYVFVFRIVKV